MMGQSDGPHADVTADVHQGSSAAVARTQHLLEVPLACVDLMGHQHLCPTTYICVVWPCGALVTPWWATDDGAHGHR